MEECLRVNGMALACVSGKREGCADWMGIKTTLNVSG